MTNLNFDDRVNFGIKKNWEFYSTKINKYGEIKIEYQNKKVHFLV